jgi:hypothetical protein
MLPSSQSPSLQDFVTPLPASKAAREALKRYERTGSYTPEDLRKILGDPTAGVEYGPGLGDGRNIEQPREPPCDARTVRGWLGEVNSPSRADGQEVNGIGVDTIFNSHAIHGASKCWPKFAFGKQRPTFRPSAKRRATAHPTTLFMHAKNLASRKSTRHGNGAA